MVTVAMDQETKVDLVEVVEDNYLDQVVEEVGLEVVLQVNGLLTLLVEVVEVLTMLEPMHRIHKVAILQIQQAHILETDILR